MENRYAIKYSDEKGLKIEYNVNLKGMQEFIKTIPIEKRHLVEIIDLPKQKQEEEMER